MTHTNLSQTKALTAVEQVNLMDAAVDAILKNFGEIDSHNEAVKKARGVVERTADNQLSMLAKALADFPEPITDEAWETVFRANVADRLTNSTINGTDQPRYRSNAVRDVMVHTIKVATMAITLAKHDDTFKPTLRSSGNLKKYADEVRPKLQAAIDPATGQPRLRANAKKPKAPKTLSAESSANYILIGCEDAERGLKSGGVILSGSKEFGRLQASIKKFPRFKRFYWCVAEMEELAAPELDVETVELTIMNTSVMAQTVTSEGAS